MNTDKPSGRFLHTPMSRRTFVRACIAGLAALAAGTFFARRLSAQASTPNGRPKHSRTGAYDLVAAKGEDPYQITVKAVETMGGMERFIPKNATVVIKPNIGWDRTPEQAGNTNPFVVAALIDLSFKAGAKRVNIFDVTCNDQRRCYENSGIAAIAKKHGASIYFPDTWNTIPAHFGYQSLMDGWPILRDAIECDTFINVPVLKDHGLTRLTLSMKNLMGVCAGNRGLMHAEIGKKLVDLTDFISPDLTIIDAYRMLVRNGPSGGNLADVTMPKTVVAGTDPVLTDTFACTIAETDPQSIPYLAIARQRGFGSCDLARATIARITV